MTVTTQEEPHLTNSNGHAYLWLEAEVHTFPTRKPHPGKRLKSLLPHWRTGRKAAVFQKFLASQWQESSLELSENPGSKHSVCLQKQWAGISRVHFVGCQAAVPTLCPYITLPNKRGLRQLRC